MGHCQDGRWTLPGRSLDIARTVVGYCQDGGGTLPGRSLDTARTAARHFQERRGRRFDNTYGGRSEGCDTETYHLDRNPLDTNPLVAGDDVGLPGGTTFKTFKIRCPGVDFESFGLPGGGVQNFQNFQKPLPGGRL